MTNQTHNQPTHGSPQVQQSVVVMGKAKSVGVAFLLAFLFGPLGLLYASVTGGIVMFIAGVIIGIVTIGIGLIFVWVACIIWAVVAADSANKKLRNQTGMGINMNLSGPPVPTEQGTHVPQGPVGPRVDVPSSTKSSRNKFCTSCGSEIRSGSRFCGNCGAMSD